MISVHRIIIHRRIEPLSCPACTDNKDIAIGEVPGTHQGRSRSNDDTENEQCRGRKKEEIQKKTAGIIIVSSLRHNKYEYCRCEKADDLKQVADSPGRSPEAVAIQPGDKRNNNPGAGDI